MRLLERTTSADTAVHQQLQPLRAHTWTGATTAVGSIAGDAVLLALAARRVHRAALTTRQAAAIASVVVAERSGTKLVKRRIGRRRPPERRRPKVALNPTSASFPSRHASFGFFCATVLAPGERRIRLYALASVVAVCRLHQGVHAPSDLLVGALVGATAGSAANALVSRTFSAPGHETAVACSGA